MAGWTHIEDAGALERALRQARGCYQRALLRGNENLSGSTLRGLAKKYGSHYARSRRNLLHRLSLAGIPWSEAKGEHQRRILVLGEPPARTSWERLLADPV